MGFAPSHLVGLAGLQSASATNTYTHVLSDETEVDYGVLIRARMTHTPLYQEAEIVR